MEDKEMQLEIINPQEGKFLQKIQWNREEITSFVKNVVENYGNIAYTEETANEAKKDRATLNRLKKSLDDRRKIVKKEILKPYDQFEAEVKQVISMIDQPISMIDKQLDVYERQYAEEKKRKIKEHYTSRFPELAKDISVERLISENPKLMNHTVSEPAAYGQIDIRCNQIMSEINAIRNTGSEFVDYAMPVYFQNLNMAEAMEQINRMAEIKKQKEEEQKKIEESKAEKEKTKAPEETSTVKRVYEEPEVSIPKQEEENYHTAKDPFEEHNKIYYTRFKCRGTREQLMGLRQYMIDHDIEFGKVD